VGYWACTFNSLLIVSLSMFWATACALNPCQRSTCQLIQHQVWRSTW